MRVLRRGTVVTSADTFDLDRFVRAQASVYDQALSELRAGRKRSHWMWFVFPQLAGLGLSSMAQRYAIASIAEARAYLAHPVLGFRLVECARALLSVPELSALDIMGSPDDMKLRSCATLVAQVGDEGLIFNRVLDRFFCGAFDARTIALVRDVGDHA